MAALRSMAAGRVYPEFTVRVRLHWALDSCSIIIFLGGRKNALAALRVFAKDASVSRIFGGGTLLAKTRVSRL